MSTTHRKDTVRTWAWRRDELLHGKKSHLACSRPLPAGGAVTDDFHKERLCKQMRRVPN